MPFATIFPRNEEKVKQPSQVSPTSYKMAESFRKTQIARGNKKLSFSKTKRTSFIDDHIKSMKNRAPDHGKYKNMEEAYKQISVGTFYKSRR